MSGETAPGSEGAAEAGAGAIRVGGGSRRAKQARNRLASAFVESADVDLKLAHEEEEEEAAGEARAPEDEGDEASSHPGSATGPALLRRLTKACDDPRGAGGRTR